MPLPPPPNAAFTTSGKPSRAASFFAFARSTGSRVPGTIGMPAASAIFRASALSPIASIAGAVGPTNVMPASSTACANCARSARKPYPGCTRVAFDLRATSTMRSIDRYEADASTGPIRNASSAISTWSASRSASEYTATVVMPRSRHVRAIRIAISPRLAIRSFCFRAMTGHDIASGVGEVAVDRGTLERAAAAAGSTAPVRWDDVTTSTNETAMRLASEGAPAWTLVAAGHQTRGRGRAGRTWADRSGRALLLSVVLRPALDAERLGLVSLATGAAMADAISRVAGLDARCKWPNDLLVDGAKVGGVLAESELDGPEVRHVVAGVGVNIEPPDEVARAAGIGDVDEELLVSTFLRTLASLLEGESGILDAWRARADTLGRHVEATTVDGAVVRGVAADLDADGALLVEADGGRARVAFGDVAHVAAGDR
jgi:BirA family biotin operon repressor/biotin-[acetyl-CoA-carboxylase] ligase